MLIGSSDFLGARSAGRTTPLQTTTAAFLGGAIAVAVYSPFLGSPSRHDLVLGAFSGVAAFVALTTLWWAYARSSVGVAAPIAAVVSTVLPVLYDAARGESPGALGWCGVVIGCAALVLTSWAPGSHGLRDGIVLGALAGVAFAAMFLILTSIIFWALFEQAGSSLNLFTDRHVDRGGVPASTFQSISTTAKPRAPRPW